MLGTVNIMQHLSLELNECFTMAVFLSAREDFENPFHPLYTYHTIKQSKWNPSIIVSAVILFIEVYLKMSPILVIHSKTNVTIQTDIFIESATCIFSTWQHQHK